MNGPSPVLIALLTAARGGKNMLAERRQRALEDQQREEREEDRRREQQERATVIQRQTAMDRLALLKDPDLTPADTDPVEPQAPAVGPFGVRAPVLNMAHRLMQDPNPGPVEAVQPVAQPSVTMPFLEQANQIVAATGGRGAADTRPRISTPSGDFMFERKKPAPYDPEKDPEVLKYRAQHPQEPKTNGWTLDGHTYATEKEYLAALGKKESITHHESGSAEPSWQTVQDRDGNLIQVNPKTGATRPLNMKGKAPAPRVDPVTERAKRDSAALKAEITTAVHALDNRPQSVGLKFAGPESLMNRLDPDGIPVRAGIANVGSMITLMRSGGAVSDGEFERIAPFIPKASDNAQTVRSKLVYLGEWLDRKASVAAGAPQYSPDNPFAGGGQ